MSMGQLHNLPQERGSMTIRGHNITFYLCDEHMMGKRKNFWRADRGMETIVTMCKTKSECISEARTFLRREAENQERDGRRK